MVVESENDVDGTAEEATVKRGPSETAGRPRTRRIVMEEERLRKEKEAKLSEPRRSNRDHDVSSYLFSLVNCAATSQGVHFNDSVNAYIPS